MNQNTPELKIELMVDDSGSLVPLKQDKGGNFDRAAIHQVHVLPKSEKFDLVVAGGEA